MHHFSSFQTFTSQLPWEDTHLLIPTVGASSFNNILMLFILRFIQASFSGMFLGGFSVCYVYENYLMAII